MLWKPTSSRPLRLIVLAPTPYRGSSNHARKKSDGEPAYLLSTDIESDAPVLIQAYLDRWQIEPLHRDLKTGLGLGQAQAWSEKAVERIHSALAAAWSLLVLAALDLYGPLRTAAFPPLPAWRRVRPNHRPSQLDLVAMLRADIEAMRTGQATAEHNALPEPARPPLPHPRTRALAIERRAA